MIDAAETGASAEQTNHSKTYQLPFSQGSGLDWPILQALPAFKSAKILFFEQAGTCNDRCS